MSYLRQSFWFIFWLWIIRKLQGQHYFAPQTLKKNGVVSYSEEGNLVHLTIDKSLLKGKVKLTV